MRTMLALATLLIATATAGAASPAAPAAPPPAVPAAGLTLTELRDWLQAAGYKALIKDTDSGDHYIASSADGLNFDVDAYDCDKTGHCKSFKFLAFFDVGDAPFELAVANHWNKTKRWTSAYIDDDGSAVIQQDINMPEGTSYAALNDDLEIWLSMLRDFAQAVYEPLDAAKK